MIRLNFRKSSVNNKTEIVGMIRILLLKILKILNMLFPKIIPCKQTIHSFVRKCILAKIASYVNEDKYSFIFEFELQLLFSWYKDTPQFCFYA